MQVLEDMKKLSLPRTKIIGVGQIGTGVIERLRKMGIVSPEYLTIFCDPAYEGKDICIERSLPAGSAELTNRACSHKESVSDLDDHDSASIRASLEGARLTFVVSGVEGERSIDTVKEVVRISREKCELTIAVVSARSQDENRGILSEALKELAELADVADLTVVVPHSRVLRCSLEDWGEHKVEGIELEALRYGVSGILGLLWSGAGALIDGDFDFQKQFYVGSGLATIGAGRGKDLPEATAEAMCCPLLGEDALTEAEKVFALLAVREETTLYEVDISVNKLVDLVHENTPVYSGCLVTNGQPEVIVYAARRRPTATLRIHGITKSPEQ